MNTAIQTIPYERLHPGQMQILAHPARFKVVACGRRWGKTTLALTLVLHRALHHGDRIWWLAPTYSMAGQVWRDLKQATRDIRHLQTSQSEQRIDAPGGGMIAIRSTHYPDNLRGEGLDMVILDEAAYMLPDVWAEVVRPMLLERRGGALFLSTPCGRNWYYELFQFASDEPTGEWASFHFPTANNPLIDLAELASIRAQTPERIWQEEYEAHFLDDAGAVFRGIREVATAPADAQPQPDHIYVAGVDWGRDHDYTAIAILDATTRQMVALERFNRIGWDLQRGRLRALYERWRPAVIWAEANSIGSVNIEALQREGLPMRPFMTTSKSKTPLIEGLALAIERADLTLLDDANLLDELSAYTVERLPSGGFRYNAPAGLHDDTVIATALAWYGVQVGQTRVGFA